jgi:hypothetical protein
MPASFEKIAQEEVNRLIDKYNDLYQLKFISVVLARALQEIAFGTRKLNNNTNKKGN